MTGKLLVRPGTGYARVSWGRWVVDCAQPLCGSALTLGPDMPDPRDPENRIRRGLSWGQLDMQCWDCDFVTTPIVWPADPDAIEMLLRRRPDVRTRSWNPDETLEDLLLENVAHGLVPREIEGRETSAGLMVTVDGRITGGLLLDALPDAEKRRELNPGEN